MLRDFCQVSNGAKVSDLTSDAPPFNYILCGLYTVGGINRLLVSPDRVPRCVSPMRSYLAKAPVHISRYPWAKSVAYSGDKAQDV